MINCLTRIGPRKVMIKSSSQGVSASDEILCWVMQQVSRESASQEPEAGSRRLGYQPVLPMDWKVSVAPNDGASRQGASKASEVGSGFVCVSGFVWVSGLVLVVGSVSEGGLVSVFVGFVVVSSMVVVSEVVAGFVFCSASIGTTQLSKATHGDLSCGGGK